MEGLLGSGVQLLQCFIPAASGGGETGHLSFGWVGLRDPLWVTHNALVGQIQPMGYILPNPVYTEQSLHIILILCIFQLKRLHRKSAVHFLFLL